MDALDLSYKPEIVKFKFDDKFFNDGNQFMVGRSGYLLDTSELHEDHDSSDAEEFLCGEHGCQQTFRSVAAFQRHYQQWHRHTCIQCKKAFPTDHLLELHIEESHDPFFEIQESKKPMYRCYLPSCAQRFMTAAERKDHAIRQHDFPSDYRYDRPPGKSKISQKKMTGASAPSKDESFRTQTKNPRQICFGHGSQKSFDVASLRQPWHRKKNQRSRNSKSTTDIDMTDLNDALDIS